MNSNFPNIRKIVVTLFVCIIFSSNSVAKGEKESSSLTILHVNLVDVKHAAIVKDVAISIDDGKIVAISSNQNFRTLLNQTVYDAQNSFVIPALADMHVHGITIPGWTNLCVAYGVLTVRDMGASSMQPLNRLKSSIAKGLTIGPNIYACGKILDGVPVAWPNACQPVTNAEEGRRAVLEHLAHGADFIKVYNHLKSDAYDGVVEQCRQSNVVFAGHVPSELTDSEVSDAGQKSIEHLLGLYFDCVKDGKVKYQGNKTKLATFCLQHLTEKTDDATVRVFCEKLVHNDTYLCPTLSTLHSMAYGDVLVDQKMSLSAKCIPVPMLDKWDWRKDKRTNQLSASDWVKRKSIWQNYKPLVNEIHKNGVKFLCGTDLSNPYTYPGLSVHDELQLLVEFGFSPVEALRTATVTPAEYFGRTDLMGSVEVGKVADLVLLTKNPLQDIRNTRSIEAVIYHGKLLNRKALDSLEKDGTMAHSLSGSPNPPID